MWPGNAWRAALFWVPRGRRAQSALAQLRGILEGELEGIRGAGTWKSERVITSRQGPHIRVDGVSGGILNFCANNYLGLSSHPEVIQAGLQALEEFGAGLSSVRFICGTQSIHKNLEAKIARFHQREDAILYPSCYDANAGLFEALLTPEDAVLSDELNHASIIDGIRLCKAHKYRYRHLDMADLEAKLQEAQKHRLRLVATDGAFSMDGDIAPLQEICCLASRYGALVFMDECHATGFLGPTGRGTDELLGVMDQVTIINSTLGKALGGASGGYTTGPGPLVSLLRQRARPYLFSNSLPPAVVGCASKALDLLMGSNTIVQSMAAKTQRCDSQQGRLGGGETWFRSKMEAAGFTISGASHPICPVMLGDARLASRMADDMLKRGIFVIGFSYPVVPKGKARIRVQISAVHSEEDIDRCVEAFVEVGRLHGALP
ncbi:2-amino-3-ketobutyrate coenzyme A ligase, mitochondrial isoform X7 [Homo sapiens]|uniref:2-amino-3-ketobutyrate coenzyme A ligase, mitochondrial isoform X7 n=1 Tax=Homo sapiens TaxID=9606 RepID=UPI000387D281|nr:2-amino-3-ketobutyrate coenzyme A ligase, mitochondrial isoform X7 [Homo sapiens]|eukprot:XP_005261468.1 2-amino-3-ketobutyrate coenzyme A ligase, mitochondrial isoform X6 [Homo sapiens]